MSGAAVWSFDPATRVGRALRGTERAWSETNCYVDLWIGVLDALELDVTACLPFTLRADFEGDQFTFFKPPLGDLDALYGMEVQELTLWRPLVEQVQEQVAMGRLVMVEVDAFYLPDVAGTDYRTEHTKTTIAIAEIDPGAAKLGYFHNAGYFRLQEQDFSGILGLDAPADPARLPPYAEIAKLERVRALPEAELRARSVALLRGHLAAAPTRNPMIAFRDRLERDVDWLLGQPLAMFHRWAFAGLRQWGASAELAAHYLRWVARGEDTQLAQAAGELEAISTGAKALLLKVARSVNARRRNDLGPLVAGMERSWSAAMESLRARYGGGA